MYNKYILSIFFGVLIVPSVAFAGPIIRSGDAISVTSDQVLEGDFYAFGGTVLVSGEAEHDVYAMGGSVTVNAPVKGDLVILGGTVNVHGEIGDDVRIAGGEVTIAEHVTGDLVVLGGVVNILSTASVDGDILFFGSELTIGGGVKGSVMGVASNVRIDAVVEGNVSVTAVDGLTLGDRAELLGSLEYKSSSALARAQGAVVVGEVQRKTVADEEDRGYVVLLPILVMLFAALTAYLLFRPFLQKLTEATSLAYGTYGLVGLAVFFAMPFVGGLLILSVLGMFVGIVILISYLLLLLVSFVVAGITFGAFLQRPFTKSLRLSPASVATGMIIFTLLPFIPYVGFLLMLAAVFIALGSLSVHLFRHIK